MLHLLYGPAASGKTDPLMGGIRTAVAARTPGEWLLVPEHTATRPTRALCAASRRQPRASYAEVRELHGRGAPRRGALIW